MGIWNLFLTRLTLGHTLQEADDSLGLIFRAHINLLKRQPLAFAAEARPSFPGKMKLHLLSKLFLVEVILVSRIEGKDIILSPIEPCRRFLKVCSLNHISLFKNWTKD